MNRISIISVSKYIRKITLFVACLACLSIGFVSCEINDPVADISTPGYVSAGIYWDVPVTNVIAGEEVSFYAEYWSPDETIEYLGVWYDIEKTLKFTLTWPLTGYTYSVDSSDMVRENLEIKTFAHSEDSYNPQKHAYVLENSFPVSYTLSSIEYKNPSTFNAEQFNQLIPNNIQVKFINNLFPQLTYQDFRNLLIVNNQVVEEEIFESYFDTITDGEIQSRVIKAGAEEALKAHISEVSFGDLIYNRNRQYYAVEFTQGFQLNARLRIVNGKQVENFSEIKVITVL